jgi:hypothetical protein
MERRYQAWLNDPWWTELMSSLIWQLTPISTPYFRWFDSGDLQNLKMLQQIIKIARNLPQIEFWLPTQERGIMKQLEEPLPPNLAVRISTPMIGGRRTMEFPLASIILPRVYRSKWEKRVERNSESRHYCPAPLQDNKCGNCRACWSKEVRTVVYLEH